MLIVNHGPNSGKARERRSKPRINKPFQAEAVGVASDGSTFEVGTVLKNMSSAGLYFCMAPNVEVGAPLKLTVRLSTFDRDDMPVAKVAIEGIVVRTEPQANGDCGVALAIQKYRFV